MNEPAAEIRALIDAARAAREHAYAPYSSFLVGAALRTEAGELFTGCNVENASFGATICAERAAVLAMVGNAVRPLSLTPGGSAVRPRISAIAVYTDAPTLAMPCGLCRQVIAEFEREAWVVVANPREQRTQSFASLFPEPFVLTR